MPKVFVDTVAWLALLNTSDDLHQQAKQVMGSLRQQRAPLVTTDFVLMEVADALSAPSNRSQTVKFINGLRALPILQIVPVSQELFNTGWTLYEERADKGWGLTDCTSFVVMSRERDVQAFTSDHHFEQAGFTNLLKG